MGRKPVKENRLQLEYELVQRRVKGMTLQAIADDLNASGIPSLAGGKWHVNSVRRLVTEPSAEVLAMFVMGAEGLLPTQAVGYNHPKGAVPRSQQQWRARLDAVLASGKPIEVDYVPNAAPGVTSPATREQWQANKDPDGPDLDYRIGVRS